MREREETPELWEDWCLDLAQRYETVAALDVDTTRESMRTRPGSRVPPGAQDILDDDEITRAVTAVDDWAEHVCHVLLDEDVVQTVPESTPSRLRTAARAGRWASTITEDEDGWLKLALWDDLDEHLRALHRIAGRGVRHIQTGERCRKGCGGQYASTLGDRTDGAIVCATCGHEVPLWEWSRWPTARVQWITAEHARRTCGLDTIGAVYQRAKRDGWRRVGTGREVRYSAEDVHASVAQ